MKPPRLDHVTLVVPKGTAPPLYVFAPAGCAFTTANTMLGVDVLTVPVLYELPEHVREDLGRDFDEDDNTPEIDIVHCNVDFLARATDHDPVVSRKDFRAATQIPRKPAVLRGR